MILVEKISFNDKNINVVSFDSRDQMISSQESEMDRRAICAVKAAVEKAVVCKKPVAKYDVKAKKAYIQYADGKIKYVD